MSRTLKTLLGVVVVLIVVVVAGVVFLELRNSADEKASLGAIAPGTTAGAGSTRDSADGNWKVQAGDTVFVGFRIHETLRGLDKDVTGRTGTVTGTMTVAGATVPKAEFTADLANLKTDDPLRDGALKRSGPETSRFPQATFKLTAPIALPSAPKAGSEISVTAKGDLTIHGTTKSVDVPLKAKWDGGSQITAATTDGVRIVFQDYGFSQPSTPFATPDDFGFLELQLLFVPA
jgi:polyisoprenoid-binding protein YceI